MEVLQLQPGFLNLLEKVPDSVLLADDHRRYVYANEQAAALLETPREQIIGKSIDDYSCEEDVRTSWSSFLESGKQRGPFRLRAGSGAVKYVHFNAVANLFPGLHLSVLRDVTAEHEAELKQAQAARLAEIALTAAHMGWWHWSLLTGQTACSVALQRLFDLSPTDPPPPYEEFLKRIHPEDLQSVRDVLGNAVLTGKQHAIQYRILCGDGSVRWLLDRGEILFDQQGKRIGIAGVSWDVTKQRLLEQEHANDLRDLARSNRDLQRFAHVASHDLKEPLRNISALSELLTRQAGPKLNEDEREVLGMIVASAGRMAALIDGMLAYARTGLHRHPPLEQAAVRDIVSDAIENLRIAVEQSGAVIDFGELPVVTCRRSDLVQVFQNLLSNAIKYCERAPVVQVSAQRRTGEWLFCVRDNGIGVRPEHRDQIFYMFARLHRDAYPGTGAGLAICQAIIEKHGGRIWVESNEGPGAAFFFTIPL